MKRFHILVNLLLINSAAGFTPPRSMVSRYPTSQALVSASPCLAPEGSPTSLSLASPLASIAAVTQAAVAATATPGGVVARTAVLVLASAWTVVNLKDRILWPGSSADHSRTEPLPPGSMGCPFLGHNLLTGDKREGLYANMKKVMKKAGNAPVFKSYMMGMPFVSVSGVDNVKEVLQHEFRPDGINTQAQFDTVKDLFGDESLLYESDNAEHTFLRKLVGPAMSPKAISDATPDIQAAATTQIDKMLEVLNANMLAACHEFTLDIAWRVILGLDLKGEEEVAAFHQATQDWLDGVFNPTFYLPFKIPGIKRSSAFRGREYLLAKIEQKLQSLDRNGPDGSTLSNIYFETDGENGARKLTRQQVIDNALILILAGSETSSNTLTLTGLMFCKHPEVFRKVKEEQDALQAAHGPEMTKALLDSTCPYLDAVIKETLRIFPITTLELRKVGKTIAVDGKQIPKDWSVLVNIFGTHKSDPVTAQADGSHMDMDKGFRPERWLNAATKPSAWMPFGTGARRCIGERLAMTEMKVFLATLARRVDSIGFSEKDWSDNIEWKTLSVMPLPADGLPVKLAAAAASSSTPKM